MEGGEECTRAFEAFLHALRTVYREHDPLVQALAAHFHLAAMHPFLDGNGRTVRALEAIYLQRAGLRDSCFIAMSNFYYEENISYLAALGAASRESYDITPFLLFGLRGVAEQSRRLLKEVERHVQKALFRNLMHDLFGRLKSPRRRVIAERQVEVLKQLLSVDEVRLSDLLQLTPAHYSKVGNPVKAQMRDIAGLFQLQTIRARRIPDGDYMISASLRWPTLMSGTEFFEEVKKLPTAKGQKFLS